MNAAETLKASAKECDVNCFLLHIMITVHRWSGAETLCLALQQCLVTLKSPASLPLMLQSLAALLAITVSHRSIGAIIRVSVQVLGVRLGRWDAACQKIHDEFHFNSRIYVRKTVCPLRLVLQQDCLGSLV